jgi:DNA-binding CsgD family transcriptional regulator/PAS domain-containing protein
MDMRGDLIGLFYQAAFDSSLWAEAARSLAAAHRANVAAIMVPPPFPAGPPVLVSSVGVPDVAQDAYAAEYHRHDLLTNAAFRANGRVVTSSEVVQGIDFRRHIFWNEFSRPHTGAWHGMAASLGAKPGLMIATRAERDDDFDAAELAGFATLTQQLSRALALGERVAAERLAALAFDGIGLAAMILTAEGRLLHANPAAEALLQRRRMRLAAGGIALPDLAQRARLQALLRVVDQGGGHLRDMPADGAGPILLQVAPLPASLRPPGFAIPPGGVALVTLRDLAPPAPPPGLLAEALGLTRAEAEVAALLLDQLSGSEVARRRGTSEETVRSQIAALQAKTGARNQRELLMRLARVG